MRRFHLNPPVNSGEELKKQYIGQVKAAFTPVHGETVNCHFPVNVYAIPDRYSMPRDGHYIGYVTEGGNKRYNLYVEVTPGSSQAAFGATPFSLRIVERAPNK